MNKDEKPIAWFLKTPKRTRVTQVNMQGEEGWMPLYPKPALDCQTCENYATCQDYADGYVPCKNGDQYQPAPAFGAMEIGMTTKDQAIASFIASVKSDRHYWEEWPEDSRKAFLELQNAAHTEPDCRTCENYLPSGDVYGFKCTSQCTKGELYKPSRTVLLWSKK